MNKKDAYYFSHDANARHDLKISALIAKYGMSGYGQFWIIIEVLRESKNYEIEQKQYTFDALAKQMQCTPEQVQSFVDDCINEYSLLKSDGKTIWSESLKRRMGIKNEIIEKRRQAAVSRWSNANAMQKHTKCNATKGNKTKGNEIKIKESIIKIQNNFLKIWNENLEKYKIKYPNLDYELQRETIVGWIADYFSTAKKRSDWNLFSQNWLSNKRPQYTKKQSAAWGGIAPNQPEPELTEAEKIEREIKRLKIKIAEYEAHDGLDEPTLKKLNAWRRELSELEGGIE